MVPQEMVKVLSQDACQGENSFMPLRNERIMEKGKNKKPGANHKCKGIASEKSSYGRDFSLLLNYFSQLQVSEL